MNTTLIKFTPMITLIAAYKTAIEKVGIAFKDLIEAQDLLFTIYGKDSLARVLQHNLYYGNLKDAFEQNKTAMKNTMWQFIIQKTDIRTLLTETKRRELDDMIKDNKAPEIEVETVQAFITNLTDNLPDIFLDACKAAFETLRPPGSQYKTNTEFEIGSKAILNYMVDCSFGGCNFNYRKEHDLISLDNVFHLLDGKGIIKYPHDLPTVIKQAIKEQNWSAETAYFKCQWYKKGSMHIKFKRLDLVSELNKIAGGNRIKP